MNRLMIVFAVLFSNLAFGAEAPLESNLHLDRIKLPPGFKISVFQANLKNVRSMTYGSKDIIFVGTREEGKVYAITPDHKVHVIAKELNMPNGVAFRDGALYVAEVNRVLKYAAIESKLDSPPKPEVIYNKYPTDAQHGWKFIAFGPDGKLYIPVGAPCNICNPTELYASITRMNADGTGMEVVEKGIRNTVGFDWQPDTKQLWFTDNGRDMLGDNTPNDELNFAPKVGMHFGYPFCHEGSILDPEFGQGKSCADYTAPIEKMGPHVAALGMRFYVGKQFPKEYDREIFVAEHGSWNRTQKSGYQVVGVKVSKDGKSLGKEVFATGWMQNEKAWGRPVDVMVAHDGSLLVSDDTGDAIYQISYSGNTPAARN